LRKTPIFRRKLSKIAENCDHNIDPRFARWYIFKPKLPIWVNFGGACNETCWYILSTFGIFHGFLVYYPPFCNIFTRFGMKNLATLVQPRVTRLGESSPKDFFENG
jgi:hypothetical protein